jgi:cytochrome c553
MELNVAPVRIASRLIPSHGRPAATGAQGRAATGRVHDAPPQESGMCSKQTLIAAAALTASLALSTIVRADGDAGMAKAQRLVCQACHASAATGDIPLLAGQRESYVAKQLKAFKAGARKNPLMSAITSALSDTDIANLAAFWSRQAAGSDTTVASEVAAIRRSKMTFPREFPRGFVRFDTTNKEDRHVVAKAFVNAVALDAVRAGTALPDGSVIIVMNYAPKLDADNKPIADKDGTWIPDQLKYYEGMQARAGWGDDIPEPLRNANWSYAIFSPDKAVRAEINQANCLACHKRAASTTFVFDLKKIQAKVGAK